jgi:hypothetical protein
VTQRNKEGETDRKRSKGKERHTRTERERVEESQKGRGKLRQRIKKDRQDSGEDLQKSERRQTGETQRESATQT